jgi:hypothetical protein
MAQSVVTEREINVQLTTRRDPVKIATAVLGRSSPTLD